MKTNLTFDPEFEQLYKSWCNDETMSSLLDLSGVGVGQVDIGAMSHKYFKESWHEEGLIDQNANSNNIGPINYGLEIAKPTMKLLGLYLLHRYLRKDHPLEVTNELLTDVITGEYYVHDSSGIGIQIPYCYAWSTMWVAENGIPYGQLPSQPPKHARSFVGQVAEVTMDLSQEFAGAVAPADMLIVYSYFAKKEELTNKEIENDLQSFVHIMNKQFRPGGQCVDQETEVLTPTGFKNYNTLSVGDDIYTWNDGELNIQQVKAVNVYDHDGDMHVYSGRDTIQMVTPNHRVLHKVNNSDEYMLSESSALIAQKTPLAYPVAMLSDNREDYDISDDMLKLCVFVITDGNLRKTCGGIRFYKSENRWGGDEFRATCECLGYDVTAAPRDGEGSFAPVVEYYLNSTYAADVRSLLGDSRDIPDWMFNLSKRQAALVIDTWAKLDGYSDGDRMKLQCDTYDIADALQHICFLAGKGSRITERTIGNNVTPTIYVIPYNRVNKSASCKDVVHYTGKVWCPSTDDGVVVFRKDGKLFISGNSPFTNLSILDRENMESLFGDAIFPDGSKLDLDFAMHVQDVFLEWFSQGNPTTGEPYRFPVTTMNITKDENGKVIDLDFLFKLAYYNTKLGAFNIHSGERAKLAMCCRFVNNPEDMAMFKTDTFGNGGLNIGSHRIVAMNMPRYAYQASSVEEFLVILGERMERAAKILHTHRTRILQKRIEQGFLRAFTVGIASLESMFSTIGTIGFPEAIEALGVPLIAPDGYTLNPEAKELQVEILKFMDKKRTDLSKRYGVPFNIEEVPGESAAINLRNKDAILFDSNVHPRSLYSNQFIPVTVPVSKKDRIEATGEYMRYMTGGSILHLNVDEAIKDPMVMYEVMKYMIESGVDHFAINYGFSRCVKGHSCTGIHNLCPECLSMIEDYLTRIVGYFVPVSTWNRERRVNDFGKRVQY
jgi:anaerobic ribonucleoside-triphosphate reductase